MNYLTGRMRNAGEHARLGRWFRRRAETGFQNPRKRDAFANARDERAPGNYRRNAAVIGTRRGILMIAAYAVFSVSATEADPQQSATPYSSSPSRNSPVDQLIPWLLDEQQELRGIAFSEVIFDTTGKRVLPIEPKNENDARVIKQISAALDQTVKRLNTPGSPVQQT